MLAVALVLCLCLAAVLVLVLLGLGRKQDAERAELDRRFLALGQALGAENEGGALRVTAQGQPFVLRLRHGRAGRAEVEIEAAAGGASARPPIVIRRETSLDMLGKKLRINREVQTGDATFDAAVYVESDAPDFDVQRVLGEARVRERVLALLDAGFSAVAIHDGGGKLLAVRDAGERFDADALRGACGELGAIAEALPTPSARPHAPPLWLAGPIAAVVSAVLAFVGFYLLSWARGAYYPLGSSATIMGAALGLVAWLCTLPLVGVLVRGRSVSFRLFGACFCFLLLGMPLSGAGTAIAMNGRMDADLPACLGARVASKGSRTYKTSTSYFVHLTGLPGESAPVELPVQRDVFTSLHEGQDVFVEVGQGRFGWEWLKGIRLDDCGGW
ncbi:hypothetical protein [Polyangium sp. y55x31]|uniref:hypothetical protein n=1 Tax=Polyangium sp. y55x31 TaxID=3042688 RepID=UPI00248317CF|nr:hypothetical protein [Polyangium sp. y55x31]MDI1477072.1 hypothetical protein [Polyangium sp. y55x31]